MLKKSVLHKALPLAAAAALWVGLAASSPAQAPADKPIAVIAFSGYQELVNDLDFAGSLSGNPEMGRQLEAMLAFFTQGKGVDGLDKERPWGAAVTTNGVEFKPIVFVPVADGEKLLATVSQFAGPPEDAGDDVREYATEQASVFVKEHNGWLFASQTKESLSTLPDDPVQLLDDLHTRYDLAVQLNVQNIPAPFRQMAVDQIKLGVELGMEKGEDETEEQYELRRAMAKRGMDQAVTAINDMDQITVGWSMDSERKNTFLEVAVSVVEGSETAAELTDVEASPSAFGGFLMPDAVATMHVNGVITEAAAAEYEKMANMLQAKVEEKLEESGDFDEQSRAVINDLVRQLKEIMDDTIATGRMQAGMVVVGEGPIAAVAGGYIADGRKLEELAKKVHALVAHEPGAPQFEWNVEEFEGVRFHTAEVAIPEKPGQSEEEAEAARRLFGDSMNIALAFGVDSAYIAVGQDGVGAIKRVIGGAQPAAGPVSPSSDLAISVGRIARLAANVDPNAKPEVLMVSELLSGVENDHLRLTARVSDNTVTYRLEFEEGLLKAAVAAGGMANEAGAPASPDDESNFDEPGFDENGFDDADDNPF